MIPEGKVKYSSRDMCLESLHGDQHSSKVLKMKQTFNKRWKERCGWTCAGITVFAEVETQGED